MRLLEFVCKNMGSAPSIGRENLKIEVVEPRKNDTDSSRQAHGLVKKLCILTQKACVAMLVKESKKFRTAMSVLQFDCQSQCCLISGTCNVTLN